VCLHSLKCTCRYTREYVTDNSGSKGLVLHAYANDLHQPLNTRQARACIIMQPDVREI